MSPESSFATHSEISLDHFQSRPSLLPAISWAAILAGLTAAIALEVLLVLLGSALGFTLYTPLTDTNPVANLGEGAAIIQGVSAVVSLWSGGWVAGRFARPVVPATGWLHGFLVWCAATVAGVLVVSAGAGWAIGDLSKIVGGGLSLAGKPAAAAAGGVTDLAKDAVKQSGDSIASFGDEAASIHPSGQTPAAAVKAKRELGLAIARYFNPAQQANATENRAALVNALTANSGLNKADAEQMVTDWTTSYERLKSDLKSAKDQADAKARELAEEAAHDLAILSFGAFIAFVLGAVAAGFGGELGAKFTLHYVSRSRPVV